MDNTSENKPDFEDFGTGQVKPNKPEAQAMEVPKVKPPEKPQAASAPVAPIPAAPPAPAMTSPPSAPKASAPPPSVPVAPPAQPTVPKKKILSKEEIIKRDAKRNKKLMLGCGSAFGCATIVLIVLIFIFVGTGSSAMAESLGINQQALVNSLILIVNIFFGIGAFITFILTIGGIFRSIMARKDDKETKRKGYMLSLGSFGAFIIIIMLWIGAWYYLNAKRVPQAPVVTTVQTIPESTLNLAAPVDVTFDASQLPIDTKNYEVISYFWDFGDGNASAGTSVETHRYEKKGDGRYNVKLTVTLRNKTTGEEETYNFENIVTIADEKVAAVINVDNESGNAPLTVKFDGSESTDPDGTIETYAWEIDGAGFTEGDKIFTHTFEQVGTYTVRLRVTNTQGKWDIAEQKIIVAAGNVPVPVIDVLNSDGAFYVDQNYTFDASKSSSSVGSITKYEWDFGDGSAKAKTRTAQHSFDKEGIYVVVLTVTDEDGSTAETTLEVEVKIAASAPNAVMKSEPAKESADATSISGTVPFEVTFDGTSSTDPDDDIVDYQWDFDNDGEYDGVGETVAWVFNDPGTYTVSLVVTDSAGFEGKDVLLVKALSRGLEPVVTADPVSGVVPLTVTFDATGSSYSDGQIVSYEWDFGDGSLPRSDVGKVTYKYTKIGNFTATVKVRTNDGKEDTAKILISVRQVPLVSCFEPSSTVGTAPLTVTFNPQCSTGTIAKYRWVFGNGETSATRKPTYTFGLPGSYEVTLEVSDAQNVVDTSSKFITVTGEITN